MHKTLHTFFTHLWQSVLYWILAMMLWGVFRYYGLPEEQGIRIEIETKNALQMKKILPLFAFSGFLVGVLYASVEFAFEKYTSKRYSIGLNIILKTLIYLIFIILIATLMIELGTNLLGVEKNNELGWWRRDKGFWVTVLYFLVGSLVFSFINIASDKFGKGVFLKMLVGSYKKPQEEERIFMFLD